MFTFFPTILALKIAEIAIFMVMVMVNLRMFTFFPTILALKMADIAIFMVMVMVMTFFMVKVITNGFYTIFEDVYPFPHHFST